MVEGQWEMRGVEVGESRVHYGRQSRRNERFDSIAIKGNLGVRKCGK